MGNASGAGSYTWFVPHAMAKTAIVDLIAYINAL
jgi:hypothetical protein